MHVATLLTLSGLLAPGTNDWPSLHGPLGTGASPETGLVQQWGDDGPTVSWTQDIGPGFGGAAVVDDEVYLLDRILGEADVLRCFDLNSGDELWSFEYEAPGRLQFNGSRMVPTIVGDHVYTLGGFGHVYCFDRTTHEPVWNVHLEEDLGGQMPGFGYSQSPVIQGDRVILSPMGEETGLVALDRFTGEEEWRSAPLGTTQSSPVLIELGGVPMILIGTEERRGGGGRGGPGGGGPGGGFGGRGFGGQRGGGDDDGAGQDNPRGDGERRGPPREDGDRGEREGGGEGGGKLTAIDPETGGVLWSADARGTSSIVAPLRIDDTHFLMTSRSSALFQIQEAAAGEYSVQTVFNAPLGSSLHLPMLFEDHLYLITGGGGGFGGRRGGGASRGASGRLVCLDMEGNEVWRSPEDQPGYGTGNLLLAGGLLYIQDGYSGALRVVEPTPAGYHLKAEADLFDTADARGDQQAWSPMALSDGRLLIRSQDQLKCVDLRADA